MSKVDVTLVLPCYNEAQHFEKSCEKIFAELEKSPLAWEVLFIDDASNDDTPRRIRRFIATKPPISTRAFYHNKNIGRGGTVAEGIHRAKGEIVGYMDIDCEIPPHYIPVFVEKTRQKYDIVCARRIYTLGIGGIIRFIASKAYVVIQKVVLNVNFPDTEAGFKFFKKKKIASVLSTIRSQHWFWDTEVVVRSDKIGIHIGFIPVVFLRRSDKTSTVNLIPDTIDYLRNLWRLKQELEKGAQ